MVDALVSGASAARRAGSSPVLGTTKQSDLTKFPYYVKSLFNISSAKWQLIKSITYNSCYNLSGAAVITKLTKIYTLPCAEIKMAISYWQC